MWIWVTVIDELFKKEEIQLINLNNIINISQRKNEGAYLYPTNEGKIIVVKESMADLWKLIEKLK